MAGKNSVDFNPGFFDTIMRSAGVVRLTESAAQQALNVAQATAPVDTGAYRAGLKIERHSAKFRDSVRVVGTDPKTMIIESKTGNLARALKSVKKSG